MKTLLHILLVGTIVLTSCTNEQIKNEITGDKKEQVDPSKEIAKLDAFLRKFDEPSQIFKVPGNKLIKVKGKQGTIILINPSDLETESGQPLASSIEIELKELSNQQQLLRANAQTVSDGQLLVSGGACYINATSGGGKIKLKTGKTYSVAFPKTSNNEMSLYYGQRDSSGNMNWKQAGKYFKIQKPIDYLSRMYDVLVVTGKDTSRKTARSDINAKDYQEQLGDSKLSEKVYAPIALDQFGWINCDRLFNKDAPRTTVQFVITNKVEEVNYVSVSLIFNDIKSIMKSYYYIYDDKIEGDRFENIPVGMKARFLAVSYQHDKIFAALTDEKLLAEKHKENLLLKEMSEKEFDELMGSVKGS